MVGFDRVVTVVVMVEVLSECALVGGWRGWFLVVVGSVFGGASIMVMSSSSESGLGVSGCGGCLVFGGAGV
eukprot:11781812-Alexandrium_andersonii.AAC.1